MVLNVAKWHCGKVALSYNVGWSPFLRHLISLCAISNHIRHDGITESTLVLIHQNGLAAMMSQVVFQITTEIRWREVNLNALLRIVLLNELQRRHKVAIGTNQHNCICNIEYTISYHADRDVYIGFLFFWP